MPKLGWLGPPLRVSELARRIGSLPASAARYLERLGDAVVRGGNQQWSLVDPVFGMWLRWRQPGGTVVPMTVIGDEAELEIARKLSVLGFELVYQSRASRGSFDLLGVRAGLQVGLQVKRSALPVRFSKSAWARLRSDGQRLGWRWMVAAVTPDSKVYFFDPRRARMGPSVTFSQDQAIDNILAWLEMPSNSAGGAATALARSTRGDLRAAIRVARGTSGRVRR